MDTPLLTFQVKGLFKQILYVLKTAFRRSVFFKDDCQKGSQEFLAFKERFITLFTKARHWTLS
jgi:hypothetical protein